MRVLEDISDFCGGTKTPAMTKEKVTLFWFRRDLRLEDNAGLYHALKKEQNVLPLFIFDTDILEKLEQKADKRVDLIHQVILRMAEQLKEMGTSLLVMSGRPADVFRELVETYEINAVYTNKDYEPAAISRDLLVKEFLNDLSIPFFAFKDQVIFEATEVVKDDGTPYSVFTPYSRKWKAKCNAFYCKSYPVERYYANFVKTRQTRIPSLAEIGFSPTGFVYRPPAVDRDIIRHYAQQRDFPAIHGTSRLSVHLRFGTISIRKLVQIARNTSETWLNELIWRDFYMAILVHYPHCAVAAFKPQYNRISWRNNAAEFRAWCEGRTGYPIVDAGMRELNHTGFMHNRVRMIVASFLTKHLLINWQWGEAYFAEKLLDFDLSANNGGWQWAAGSGCDAAPYFRVFNPYEQTKKFDPDFKYIRKWVPEFEEFNYPQPIVEHKFARERALAVYQAGLNDI